LNRSHNHYFAPKIQNDYIKQLIAQCFFEYHRTTIAILKINLTIIRQFIVVSNKETRMFAIAFDATLNG